MSKKSPKTAAANAVIQAVKKRRKLTDREIYSLLKHDWPASQHMVEQLTYFLTTELTLEGEPILYPILEEALNRYCGVVYLNNSEKVEDIGRVAVFLDQLISSTLQRMNQQWTDAQGEAWHLDCGEGFSTWRQAHPGELTGQPYQINDTLEGRRRLYYLMTHPRMRLVFTRSNYYEEAIMAGDVRVDPADRRVRLTRIADLDLPMH